MLAPWKESYEQPIWHIKKERHYFVHKGLSSQGDGFSSSHVWVWELDYKESWAPKNWCFWTVVLEKAFESPLYCKVIEPAHLKGDQSWVFTAWADVEAETPILWPPDVKSWLIWKDPDAGKDRRQQEKGTTEDEVVRWRHPLKWTWVWVDSGSWWWTGRPACCGTWGHKELTCLSAWTELLIYNVMLISFVKQSDSVIHIHLFTLQILFSYRSLESIEWSALCYTVVIANFYFTYSSVYISTLYYSWLNVGNCV